MLLLRESISELAIHCLILSESGQQIVRKPTVHFTSHQTINLKYSLLFFIQSTNFLTVGFSKWQRLERKRNIQLLQE